MTIGTGNQIRTIFVGEGPGNPLDHQVNMILIHQLQHHEIIDIKPLGMHEDENAAVLIIYKVIGI